METALKTVKALRRADPTFANEFKAIAAAEIKYRKHDPVEGSAFREGPASAVTIVRRILASTK